MNITNKNKINITFDKSLKFRWPTKKPIIAKRDTKWKSFEEFKKKYKGL